jgi:serine/threonine-protein kinase ATR
VCESESHICRQLVETDGPSRIALLDKLVQFGCAVSGCKQPDLPHPSKRLKLSTLPAALSAVARFLDGPEVEVPPGVRRRAYTFLSDAIKHHTITPERDGLAHAATTILRGIVDPDRSVRLGAGYVSWNIIRVAAF